MVGLADCFFLTTCLTDNPSQAKPLVGS